MEKVYVIYEMREESFELLNNLQGNFDCIKVFDNEYKAQTWLRNELEFQCNIIKLNGKVIYKDDEEESDLWVAKILETENLIEVNVYYCDEWQYTMYLKEMVVE